MLTFALSISAGKYFITVRALNKVDYGGLLGTTICHTTPYIIDNTMPIIYEIFDIKYKEALFEISAKQNST